MLSLSIETPSISSNVSNRSIFYKDYLRGVAAFERAEIEVGRMERVKTGIAGLDEMLNGGIPARRHVAVYGGPGAGKTSFGFEFLYRGAKEGENGLYISLEETVDDITENMRGTFPMMTDVGKLIEEKKLEIVKPDRLEMEEVATVLEDRIPITTSSGQSSILRP